MTEKAARRGAPWGDIDLETHIPYRLGRLTNLMRLATTEHYVRQSRVTGREWRVLVMVGIVGPVNARTICRLTGMDKATVTRALNHLTAIDMVVRTEDPMDRRSKILQLTPKGRGLCEEVIPRMQEGGDRFAAALDDEERRVFLHCLNKLTRQAEDMLEEQGGSL